jgi:hypothetical protein
MSALNPGQGNPQAEGQQVKPPQTEILKNNEGRELEPSFYEQLTNLVEDTIGKIPHGQKLSFPYKGEYFNYQITAEMLRGNDNNYSVRIEDYLDLKIVCDGNDHSGKHHEGYATEDTVRLVVLRQYGGNQVIRNLEGNLIIKKLNGPRMAESSIEELFANKNMQKVNGINNPARELSRISRMIQFVSSEINKLRDGSASILRRGAENAEGANNMNYVLGQLHAGKVPPEILAQIADLLRQQQKPLPKAA